MTTRTVTLLVADLRQRADLRGQTTRHPDSDLKQSLLQSLRSLRSLVTRAGGPFFIVGSTPGPLPTAPSPASETFLEVPWPDGAVSIHGVDVLVSTVWCPLNPVQFAARRDYQGIGGRPRAFHVRALPVENPGQVALTAGVIQLYPSDTQGLSYRVWYVPELVDLADGDLVQCYDGDWLEWVLWDSVIKYAAEDDDVQNVDQVATRERAIVEQRIVGALQSAASPEPISPRRHRAYR